MRKGDAFNFNFLGVVPFKSNETLLKDTLVSKMFEYMKKAKR